MKKKIQLFVKNVNENISEETEFPKQEQIENKINELKNKIKKIKKIKCENEIEENIFCENEANLFCANCKCNFCEKCFKDGHSKHPFNKHIKTEINNSKSNLKVEEMCKIHEDQKKIIFCKDDNVECCLFCANFGEHKGHNTVLINDLILKEKENQNLILKEKKLKFKNLNKKIIEIISNIEKNHLK
jgi:hypothetical protein